ncbi:MAG: hypothetical protein J1F16_07850 [Muribaculaceae bacterium]|nr:hypothetical protein [Muribaculaceae bacterium]
MSNMFENVKSDSHTQDYNPSSVPHNNLIEYEKVAERIEVATRNMSESAAAFLDLLLEDNGTLKDFPHIKETNKILLKNYRMMENIGEQIDILSYDIKNFNKTIPSHIEMKLCEDDWNLIQSFIPKWKSMLKILHPSLLAVGIVIGLFIGANLIVYNAYTSSFKEFLEKNELLDQSLKENSDAIALSEYIKSHYPKIYGKWEKENHSAN